MGKRSLPKEYIGGGIEWTPPLSQSIFEHLDELDCIEIIAENFFYGHHAQVLKKLGNSGKPVLIHAVETNLGSTGPFDQKHFDKIKAIADQVNTINMSDHVGFCKHSGMETGQPAIVPFTKDAADAFVKNLDIIQAQINVPYLIENEANRYQFYFNELSEPAFFNRILEKSGCGLLLDLTNLYTNQINFGTNSFAWLQEVDLTKVNTIHMAGGHYDQDGMLIDSHCSNIPDEVWELYEYTLNHVIPSVVLLERTGNIPPFRFLQSEIERMKSKLPIQPRQNSKGDVRELSANATRPYQFS